MEKNIIKFDKSNFNAHNNSLTQLTDSALSGMIDQLDVYLFLKKLETTVKDSLSLLKDGAADEAVRYGKGEHLVDGAYISVKASAGRWKFSDRVAEAKAKVKELEDLEKAAYKAKGNIMVNQETGEEVEPAQFFPGKEVINVKIPKI
jgi:hypothetical protein